MQRYYTHLITGFLLLGFILLLTLDTKVSALTPTPNPNDYTISLQSTSGTANSNNSCTARINWSFKDDSVNPFITELKETSLTDASICQKIAGCTTLGQPIVRTVPVGTTTYKLRILNGQVHKEVKFTCNPTAAPTTVPQNQQCGDICNPQLGANACSGGLKCSSSSILIDNLIPDPVHALGICATEDLVYTPACMQDIFDGRPIGSCCQVIGDPPTIPSYFTRVSLNEVDDLPSTYNAPIVASYKLNTNTKVADCVPDPSISSRKAFKCNDLVEGTDYTYKAVATGKTSNVPTIISQINGRASTSTIYDLWVTYTNKAVIVPAAPNPTQSIELTVSGKKLRSPEAKMTIVGASEALGSINQEFILPADSTTFSKTLSIPPLPAGTYKVKVSVAEGHKASIPASILTYDSYTFTVATGNCLKKNLGDANCDDLIDDKDFEIWKSEFTRTASSNSADFNSDSRVSVHDFEIWRKNRHARQRDE